MSREEFDETFERLRDVSNRHAEIQRDVDDYDALNASRAELDRARSMNTAARRTIVSRRDYATPDAVPAGLGLGALTGRGRWAAGTGAVAFLVMVAALVTLLIQATRPGPLAVDGDIIEQISEDCRWQVAVPFINNGNEPIVIAGLSVLIEQRPVRVWFPAEDVSLNAGESAVIDFEHRVTPCPATPEDVVHGELWTTWRTTNTLGERRPAFPAADVRDQTMRHRF